MCWPGSRHSRGCWGGIPVRGPAGVNEPASPVRYRPSRISHHPDLYGQLARAARHVLSGTGYRPPSNGASASGCRAGSSPSAPRERRFPLPGGWTRSGVALAGVGSEWRTRDFQRPGMTGRGLLQALAYAEDCGARAGVPRRTMVIVAAGTGVSARPRSNGRVGMQGRGVACTLPIAAAVAARGPCAVTGYPATCAHKAVPVTGRLSNGMLRSDWGEKPDRSDPG
jgi:hypothetical protein